MFVEENPWGFLRICICIKFPIYSLRCILCKPPSHKKQCRISPSKCALFQHVKSWQYLINIAIMEQSLPFFFSPVSQTWLLYSAFSLAASVSATGILVSVILFLYNISIIHRTLQGSVMSISFKSDFPRQHYCAAFSSSPACWRSSLQAPGSFFFFFFPKVWVALLALSSFYSLYIPTFFTV